ncbi:MAG: hypothetical protein GY938_24405 [Ketobacter sp.]|nr:hypothetical protein [Ketobacter sp.]
MKKLSVTQILVMCGSRKNKYQKRLSTMLDKPETLISRWASTGIPFKYWQQISTLSKFSLSEICDAHAFLLNQTYEQISDRYQIIVGSVIDNE